MTDNNAHDTTYTCQNDEILTKYDQIISTSCVYSDGLEEQVKNLKKEISVLQTENSTLRSRATNSETTKDVLLKISSHSKENLENQRNQIDLQCTLSELAQLRQANSSLSSSNLELKRENCIYQAEIDNLNKKLRLQKNKSNVA